MHSLAKRAEPPANPQSGPVVMTLPWRRLLAFALLLAACSGERGAAPSEVEVATDAGEAEEDASEAEETDASEQVAGCGDEDTSDIPASLACAGLYARLGDKLLAKDVLEFEPAYPLWSDGASKRRWIQLPKGE